MVYFLHILQPFCLARLLTYQHNALSAIWCNQVAL